MEPELTALYIILGAAIHGLVKGGETTGEIRRAFDLSLEASITPDPAMTQAGKAFAETIKTVSERSQCT